MGADVAARLGLGAAVDYLLDLGIDAVTEAISYRAEHLREGLGRIPPGVRVRDLGDPRSGIVSFTVDGREPTAVRDALAGQSITVTVSHRSSTLLDMTARKLEAVVRASPHYFVSPRRRRSLPGCRPEPVKSAARAGTRGAVRFACGDPVKSFELSRRG